MKFDLIEYIDSKGVMLFVERIGHTQHKFCIIVPSLASHFISIKSTDDHVVLALPMGRYGIYSTFLWSKTAVIG